MPRRSSTSLTESCTMKMTYDDLLRLDKAIAMLGLPSRNQALNQALIDWLAKVEADYDPDQSVPSVQGVV